MEDVLDETVSSEDLQVSKFAQRSVFIRVSHFVIFKYFIVEQKFEKVFHEQLHQGKVTHKAQFEYAWCLVRSKYPTDIRKVR